MLQPGQNLLLNSRVWSIRQVRPLKGRNLELEVIGASPAAQGMTRHLQAVQYNQTLFIKQRRQGYWQANLQQDWVEHEHDTALACRPATGLDLLDAHTRHPAKGQLKNQFSWSYSRAAKYNQCPRAYYYHYYAAWEGWLAHAPAPVKRAYLLKNLTHLSQWVGSLVHETIQFALSRLKAGEIVTEDRLRERMHTRAQTDFADSQSGRYQQKPNQLTGFQEHYYQTDLTKDTWQSAWTKAQTYLHAFTGSTLYQQLCRQAPETFLEIETLQSFTVTSSKVWVQMDLARQEDQTIYIYDWKTGSIDPEKVRQQVGIYGLYAQQAWPEAGGKLLRGMIYSIADDELLEIELDEATLQTTQTAVETSIAHLQSLLLDPQANLTTIDRFPMINDLTICRQCQFRELCGR